MATVLVVDDEVAGARVAQANLEQHGHTVRRVVDGQAALAAVQAEPPDVVVLDVILPGLDGWGVLQRLKSDPDARIRAIPVVIVAASDEETDRLRGGIEGALRFLLKPIATDELACAVQQVLDGGPEPAQRKAVQQRALARIAEIEGGRGKAAAVPLVRLTRLERQRSPLPIDRLPPVGTAPALEGDLTEKQRQMLRALIAAPSVSDAAVSLGMSRSNIYASLRRIGRKLDVPDVSALLRLLRSGALAASLEP